MLSVLLMVGGAFLFLAILAVVVSLIMTAVIDRVVMKERGRREQLIFTKLPGNNCGECGFDTCAAYASALCNRMSATVYCPHLTEGRLQEITDILSPKQEGEGENGDGKPKSLWRRDDKWEQYEHWNERID